MRVIIRILAFLALLLAFLVPVGAATAAPANSERFDTFIFDVNACNGEIIKGEGTAHVVFKEQKDGTFVVHFRLHARGVGDQGNEYVLNGKTTLSNDASAFKQRMLLISKGSAPNQVVVITLDPDGNYIFEEDCKGRAAP